MARKLKHTRPNLESLEHRTLLSGGNYRTLLLPNGQPINEGDHARLANHLRASGLDPQDLRYGQATSKVLPTIPERRKFFSFPDGTRASLTLYGAGTLKGTSINSDGTLDLIFDGTTSGTRVIGKVLPSRRGASGRVPLAKLKDADVASVSASGTGSNQIGIVNLADFDLVAGGVVNLSAGVQILQLGVVGPDTLMTIRSLPVPQGTTLPVDNVSFPTAQFVIAPGGGTELAGTGGLAVPGAISGSTANAGGGGFITQIGANGELELIPVQGTGDQILVPGATLLFDSIEGNPNDDPLAPPQIFGFDPTTTKLLRFDTNSGNVLQEINVGIAPTMNDDVGLGLARVDGRQLVLLGIDSTVYAYDVISGAPVGSFITTSLTAIGATPITGIAHTDSRTILTSNFTQTAQSINVQESLATGSAVAVGNAYTPSREFTLSGGATGAAGLSNAFLTGSGFFDTFTPNQQQFGVVSVRPSDGSLSETGRTAVSNPSSLVTQVPPDNPPFAFGSVGLFPALVTSVEPATPATDTTPALPARNVVTTYDVTGYSRSDSFNLNWANRLTGLSESVNPELEGDAVINMVGIMTRIHARKARGMVLNGIGYLNTIEIPIVTDSTIIGLPVGHVVIDSRDNVTIISSDTRPVGEQGGVTIVPGLKPQGPFLPPDLPPL